MKRTTLQDLREAADSAVREKEERRAVISTQIHNVIEEVLADCLNKATEGEYTAKLLFSSYNFLLPGICIYQNTIIEKLRLEGLSVMHHLHNDEFTVSWEHEKGVGL